MPRKRKKQTYCIGRMPEPTPEQTAENKRLFDAFIGGLPKVTIHIKAHFPSPDCLCPGCLELREEQN